MDFDRHRLLKGRKQRGGHSFVTTLYLSNRNCWELQYILLYKYCVPIGPGSTARTRGNYILAMESDRRCRTINPCMTSPPNCARWYVVVRQTIFDNSQHHAGQLLRKRDGHRSVFFPITRYSRAGEFSAAELLDISEKFVRLKWSAHIDGKFVRDTSRLKRFACENVSAAKFFPEVTKASDFSSE